MYQCHKKMSKLLWIHSIGDMSMEFMASRIEKAEALSHPLRG